MGKELLGPLWGQRHWSVPLLNPPELLPAHSGSSSSPSYPTKVTCGSVFPRDFPSQGCSSCSWPVKVTRHKQSIHGTLKHRATSSKPGDLDVSHNSQKQKQNSNKMKRQKNMFQVKEQNKTPEENPKDMVVSNLPDIEFKEMIIKMLTKLGKRLEEINEKM